MITKSFIVYGPAEFNNYFVEMTMGDKVERINKIIQINADKLINGRFKLIKERSRNDNHILQIMTITYNNQHGLETAIKGLESEYGVPIEIRAIHMESNDIFIYPKEGEYFVIEGADKLVDSVKLLSEIENLQKYINNMEVREI